VSSNPHCGDHFSGTIHLDQSLEQKLWKILSWNCCICCNPANGKVDFGEWLDYKNPATWYIMDCKLVSWLTPKSNKEKKVSFLSLRSSTLQLFVIKVGKWRTYLDLLLHCPATARRCWGRDNPHFAAAAEAEPFEGTSTSASASSARTQFRCEHLKVD
jgi:hypothetical protein